MNVLYLTNNPNLGSTARILQCWLRHGHEHGVRAIVALPQPGDFATWLAANGVEHRVGPMPWPDKRKPFHTLRYAWGVARWAKRHGVDVIHCNEHDVYPFARLVKWFLRLPIVCHVRFKLEREFAVWAFGKTPPDYLLWTSNQQQMDSAAAVEGLVPLNRQRLVTLGLDLSTFGIQAAERDVTRAAWGFGPDEIVIATASALRPIKRLTEFVTLIARLTATNPRVVGMLAGDAPSGDEPYRAKLLQGIADTGLGRRLRWVGNLEPVEPLYHAADVFVSTSEYETFGNSVCEAMACRRPVVAYAGGSVPEVVGDAGYIVPVGDLAGLVDSVQRLIADPVLREIVGDRGRNRVRDVFNPIKSLEKLRVIYDELATRRAVPSVS